MHSSALQEIPAHIHGWLCPELPFHLHFEPDACCPRKRSSPRTPWCSFMLWPCCTPCAAATAWPSPSWFRASRDPLESCLAVSCARPSRTACLCAMWPRCAGPTDGCTALLACVMSPSEWGCPFVPSLLLGWLQAATFAGIMLPPSATSLGCCSSCLMQVAIVYACRGIS